MSVRGCCQRWKINVDFKSGTDNLIMMNIWGTWGTTEPTLVLFSLKDWESVLREVKIGILEEFVRDVSRLEEDEKGVKTQHATSQMSNVEIFFIVLFWKLGRQGSFEIFVVFWLLSCIVCFPCINDN